MSAISIKQFDTARAIEDMLKIGDTAIDLTGADVAIRFYNLLDRTTWVGEGNVTITTPTSGTVSYAVEAEDVEDAGDFEFEWVITFDDDSTLTVPTEGRVALTIWPAIQVEA